MCLAVPMKLISVHGEGTGVVAMDGIEMTVCLMLVEDPQVGDYLFIHAGYAIEKLDIREAEIRLALFASLAATYRAEMGAEVTLIAPLEKRMVGP